MRTRNKLVYLTPAANDLKEIVKYHITEVGAVSARKIYQSMTASINRLRDFPLMGQIHPDPLLAAENFRKLVLTRTYVAIYKVDSSTIYVYRIVNGARDYPSLLKHP